MNSFGLINGLQSEAGQKITFLQQSGVQSSVTNNAQQYMQVNTRVGTLQRPKCAVQNVTYFNRQIGNFQSPEGYHSTAAYQKPSRQDIENKFCRAMSGPTHNASVQGENTSSQGTFAVLHTVQQNLPHNIKTHSAYAVPRTQSNATNGNPTSMTQNMLHVQQNRSPCVYQNRNESVSTVSSPFMASVPSCHPSTLGFSTGQNKEVAQVSHNQISSQNCNEGQFSPVYQNYGMKTSQFRIPTQSSPNGTHSNLCEIDSYFPKNNTVSPCLPQNVTNKVVGTLQRSSFGSAHRPPPPPYSTHLNERRLSPQNTQCGNTANPKHFISTKQLPLPSGQPLPQCFTSGTMKPGQSPHLLSLLQQNPTFDATPIVQRRDEASSGFLPINNAFFKECQGRTSNNTSQVFHAPGSSMLLKKVNHPNLIEWVQSKQHESSAHSMPGHTGTKAVAVVPPLSQEDGLGCSTPASTTSISSMEKECISPNLSKSNGTESFAEEHKCNEEIPDRKSPEKANTLVSPDLELQSPLEKSEQPNFQSSAEKPSEMAVSQPPSEEQNARAQTPAQPLQSLSLLPTTKWKVEDLNNLILELEKAQQLKIGISSQSNILRILICGDAKADQFLEMCKTNQSNGVISKAELFCNKYATKDTVILKQVKPEFLSHLKQFQILKEGELYSEESYKSLWHNVNDQLDDIDKEFGFPWVLKRTIYVNEGDNQLSSEQSVNEVPAEIQQMEAESADLTQEKKESTVESPLTSPALDESEEDTSDSDCLFKIEILSPGKAKEIYEQMEPNRNQSNDSEVEMHISDSKETKSSGTDITTNMSEAEKSHSPMEEICCLARLMEKHSGSNTLISKCQCKDNLLHNKDTTDSQIFTFSPPGPSTDSYQIIDLMEDDDGLFSFVDPELKAVHLPIEAVNAISTENLNESTSGNKDVQEHVKAIEIQELSAAEVNTRQNDLEVFSSKESASVLFKESENNRQTIREPSDETTACLESTSRIQQSETDIQPCSSPIAEHKPLGKKRKSLVNQHVLSSVVKKNKTHGAVDLSSKDFPKAQHSGPKAKAVELVLFGSGQKEKLSSHSFSRKSCEKHTPPEVVTVKLDSFNRKTADCADHYSARQLFYEKWRRRTATSGYLEAVDRHKMNRRIGCTSSEIPKKKQPVSCEMTFSDRTRKYIVRLKKRRAQWERRKLEEVRKRRYSVSLKQSGQQTSRSPNEEDIMAPQENVILKFKVLPKSFTFRAGTSGAKEDPDPESEKLKPEEEKDQHLEKMVKKFKGSWCLNPAKQFQPLRVPESGSLFHEFQKKHKEKIHASANT